MRRAARTVLAGLSAWLFLLIPPAPRTADAQAGGAASLLPPSGSAGVVRQPEARRPDVVFVPTPQEVVDAMLELAQLRTGDVLYDLGCGDGRIVVTAARRYGVKSVGIDIDPQRIQDSLESVRRGGVGHLVTIHRADIFKTDLRAASVVTLYLLPNLNLRLLPQLSLLKPGSRVVSHSFEIRGMKPSKVVKVNLPGRGVRTVYLYFVPFEKDGDAAKPVRVAPEKGRSGRADRQRAGGGEGLSRS
jgi:hypothetical protein